MAILARLQLGRNWSDIESAGVLSGQVVVGEGLYRFVRHPIYTGDLLLLIGMQLALNSWCVLLAVLLVPVVFRKAVQEERMLMRRLPGYEAYCRRTKRFVPFVA
jgi:protein-S-isoprenylcysteine O-methyltransferase Ste14